MQGRLYFIIMILKDGMLAKRHIRNYCTLQALYRLKMPLDSVDIMQDMVL